MKLYQSATSPFVLKVRIAAAELGLLDRIEMLDVSQEYKSGGPLAREQNIIKTNPLGQVPTLLLADGTTIADSRVICEYLDGLGGGRLFPGEPKARWNALTEQSYGDGLLDAALAARYEGLLRSEEQRWQRWIDGQLAKVHATLDLIEGKAAGFGERVDDFRRGARPIVAGKDHAPLLCGARSDASGQCRISRATNASSAMRPGPKAMMASDMAAQGRPSLGQCSG